MERQEYRAAAGLGSSRVLAAAHALGPGRRARATPVGPARRRRGPLVDAAHDDTRGRLRPCTARLRLRRVRLCRAGRSDDVGLLLP